MNDFVAAGIISSADGVDYTSEEQINEEERAAVAVSRTGSLAEQLAENKARKDAEWKAAHNPNLPPAPITEEDIEFLEEREREAKTIRERIEQETVQELQMYKAQVLKSNVLVKPEVKYDLSDSILLGTAAVPDELNDATPIAKIVVRKKNNRKEKKNKNKKGKNNKNENGATDDQPALKKSRVEPPAPAPVSTTSGLSLLANYSSSEDDDDDE